MHRFSVSLLFLLSLFSDSLFAQSNYKWRLARIKDKDGFTNLREHAGKQYAVADTIVQNQYFRCSATDSNGYYPALAKNTTGSAILGDDLVEGYIYKDRVEFIDELPDSAQAKVLHIIFKRYNSAQDKFLEDTTRNKRIENKLLQEQMIYVTSFGTFENYFDRTKDTIMLMDYFHACRHNDGAYAEMTAGVLASCLTNNETIFISQLKKLKKSTRSVIVNYAKFGLEGFYGDKPKGEGGKRLQYLENKLNAIAGK